MMKINARLDEDLSQKITLLKKMTHLSVTEIVKQSLQLYYQTRMSTSIERKKILEKTGFIGCGEGDSDLSTRTKEQFLKVTEKKHGYR